MCNPINGLYLIMTFLMSKEPGTFVAERNIEDDFYLVQQIMHSLENASRSNALMAVKVDLGRAYD